MMGDCTNLNKKNLDADQKRLILNRVSFVRMDDTKGGAVFNLEVR